MTGEEALKLWLPVIKMGVESMPECSEALDMAIKALEVCQSTQKPIDLSVLNKWIGAEVLDRIRNEMHATAEKHEDGVYYLRDEWVDEIIDKYAEGSDKE